MRKTIIRQALRDGLTNIGLRMMRDASAIAVQSDDPGRDLSEEQNQALRALLNKALETHSQTELEEVIGMSQSAISGFKNGRQGTSFARAVRLCEFMGADVYEVLNLPRPEPVVRDSTGLPSVTVREFLDWYYDHEGIKRCVDAHRDVTVDDLLRLKAEPSRHGEHISERAPDEVYNYIRQLRAGGVGVVVERRSLDAVDLERDINTTHDAAYQGKIAIPKPRHRRRK